jgi:hypothetical protein
MAIKGLVDTATGAAVDPETRYAAVSHVHAASEISLNTCYPALPYTDGKVYLANSFFSQALVTSQVTANRQYHWPWVLNQDVSVPAISVEITTAGASGTVFRMAIFDWDTGSILSGTDTGAISADSTGVKTSTFSSSLSLSAGIYGFILLSDGTPTFRALSHANSLSTNYTLSGGAVVFNCHIKSAVTMGSLTNLMPSSADNRFDLPAVFFEAEVS